MPVVCVRKKGKTPKSDLFTFYLKIQFSTEWSNGDLCRYYYFLNTFRAQMAVVENSVLEKLI